jgi:hypothetical protein
MSIFTVMLSAKSMMVRSATYSGLKGARGSLVTISAYFREIKAKLPFFIVVSNEKFNELVNSPTIQRSSFQSLRDDSNKSRFLV